VKAALKRKWVAALRSGKYKQGSAALRAIREGQEEWCCLGVLAQAAGCRWEKPGRFGNAYLLGKGGTNRVFLPQSVLARVGLPNSGPKGQGVLADLNDSGKTFQQIANWIEKNL